MKYKPTAAQAELKKDGNTCQSLSEPTREDRFTCGDKIIVSAQPYAACFETMGKTGAPGGNI